MANATTPRCFIWYFLTINNLFGSNKHHSIVVDHGNILSFLIKNEANLNAENSDDKTPLLEAIEKSMLRQ